MQLKEMFQKRDLFSFHAVLDEEDTLLVYETTGKGDGVRRTSERKNEEPRWDYMYGVSSDWHSEKMKRARFAEK